MVLWLSCQRRENPGTAVITSAKEDIFWLVYPCHVCTLAWPPHCCVSGKKVALWCAKWFTDRRDINKVFTQGSEAGSPYEASNSSTEKTTARGRFLSRHRIFPHYVGQGATDGRDTFTSCHGSCPESFSGAVTVHGSKTKGKVERRENAASSAALWSLMWNVRWQIEVQSE